MQGGAPCFPIDVQEGYGFGDPDQPSGCWHKPLSHVEAVSLRMGCLSGERGRRQRDGPGL